MTDPILFWLSIGLCVIGIASLAAATAIRWPPRPHSITAPFAGPIRKLSFAESLDPERFAEAAEQSALEQFRRHFGEHWADHTVITLQGLQQWAARWQMVVEASPETTKRLLSGAARFQRHGPSGRLLPHAMGTRSGKSLEVVKEVRFSSRALAGAAAASAIVVSVAHMISAADLARKLNKVEQKLDLLLAFRRIDQEAILERIYTNARELLATPLDDLRRVALWRLRGELRQLRATWRCELEHGLREIDDLKDRAWVDRMTTVRSWYDGRVSRKISEGELQIKMVEYSLRLDQLLADASNTWDVSRDTLAGELDAIAQVGDLLKEKVVFISEDRRSSAERMAELVEAMVAEYRTLVRSPANTPAGEELPATPATALLEMR